MISDEGEAPREAMPLFLGGAPCMGNNLAVEVRYALGSRER